jgi:hypothetical protein
MEKQATVQDRFFKEYKLSETAATHVGYQRVESIEGPFRAIPLEKPVVLANIWGGNGPQQFAPEGSLLRDKSIQGPAATVPEGYKPDRYAIVPSSLRDYERVG